MRTDAETYSDVLPSRVRRRRALMTIIRSLLASTVTVVAYFVLPLSSDLAADTAVELLIGLAVLAALLTWQIREIVRSPYPAVQAVGALAVSQGARAVATAQMVGGLVVVGLLARRVVHAVQEGRGRHDSSRAR